jgi:hypothetical protein
MLALPTDLSKKLTSAARSAVFIFISVCGNADATTIHFSDESFIAQSPITPDHYVKLELSFDGLRASVTVRDECGFVYGGSSWDRGRLETNIENLSSLFQKLDEKAGRTIVKIVSDACTLQESETDWWVCLGSREERVGPYPSREAAFNWAYSQIGNLGTAILVGPGCRYESVQKWPYRAA